MQGSDTPEVAVQISRLTDAIEHKVDGYANMTLDFLAGSI